MEIIELGTVEAVKKHAPLFNSEPAWLQRRFGNDYEQIFQGVGWGTIADKDGTAWDYWKTSDKWNAHEAQ